MSGIDKEVSEHIRVELESQFKKLAEAILADQIAKTVTVASSKSESTEAAKKKGRFRLVRAAL